MTERRVLLDVSEHLSPLPRIHYVNHTFSVQEDVSKVGLIFSFHKEWLAQLFISFFDPNGFRGNRMNPGAKGDITLELWATLNNASEGAIPGVLPKGEWRVQIDIERLGEEVDYHLEVYAEFDAVPEPTSIDFPDDVVQKPEAGWYQGELHAHSTESDGKYPVGTVIQAAIDTGLDFFALTDHFTVSQWRKFIPFLEQKVALLRSTEITSHHGHANLHGMKHWVDVYVDRPDWNMNDAANAVHAQGGLFCVNHAFSGDLGWRAYDFDWHNADMMEVYHNLEGINNLYQLSLWDQQLTGGYRVVGVAGIDSHNPFEGHHKLGQVMTWVYADQLSETGIIDGLRRGRVYISRGAQLRFTVETDNAAAEMWETLSAAGSDIALHVDVLTDEEVNVFMFKNGYYFHAQNLQASSDWQRVHFHDTPASSGYYRVEVHNRKRDEEYPYITWRDHTTVRAISNPIWVK
jgi:hypothetical protein